MFIRAIWKLTREQTKVEMRKEVIGNATLYLGDCLEILPTLPKVDAVITDPPFGVGNFVQTSGNVRGAAVTWNDSAPPESFFILLRDKSENRIIWGANYFNCFEPEGGAIVWVKNQPMPDFSKAEVASCSYHKRTELVTITWTNFVNTKCTDHPCERPVSLYRWCIDKYTKRDDLVMDPFLGSGSCGVAAVECGRQFIGIERDPRYFQAACERIENAQRQQRMFA